VSHKCHSPKCTACWNVTPCVVLKIPHRLFQKNVYCVPNVMAHGDSREGKWRGNWRMEWVASTLTWTRNVVYPALLTLMRKPGLPAVGWTDSPADLNGLVRLSERRNMVSAHVPSGCARALQCRSTGHEKEKKDELHYIFRWPCISSQILANNQLDALFHIFIYLISPHVSIITVLIIRSSNFINTSSGMISLCKWLLGMLVRKEMQFPADRHTKQSLTQTNHTRWCINTIRAPDDEHCDTRNM
jgi:hypothetical protein